jgi:hypothetical protein
MSPDRSSLPASGRAPPALPALHLSGPRLRAALERLVTGAEAGGGIERWVTALRYKAAVFERALRAAPGGRLDESTFLGLCAMMPSVRRRIGAYLAGAGFAPLREAVQVLLGREVLQADAAIAEFCAVFPKPREHRYARDLAAELLHWSAFERYPLMTRWVWDQRAATGVLREIWHDDADPLLYGIGDDRETFLALRAELAQYLTDNGFFRDVPFYVDLLCAQVYASYICEQGGTFLRAEFASDHDPMQYTRRMLGLDGIDLDTGVTRIKLPDGSAFRLAGELETQAELIGDREPAALRSLT